MEYFIVYEYNQSDHMFAYVYKTNNHKLDKFGQIHFNKFISLQFIEVIGIDRYIEFFNIGQNFNYILDREKNLI